MRVKKASRVTVFRSRFRDNHATKGDPKDQVVGPAAGLETDIKNPSMEATAAWFHDCIFENNTQTHKAGTMFEVPLHEVSIENAEAQVFTNVAGVPLLYDREREELAHATLVGPGSSGGVFGGAVFLTEDDEWFRTVAEVRTLPQCAQVHRAGVTHQVLPPTLHEAV